MNKHTSLKLLYPLLVIFAIAGWQSCKREDRLDHFDFNAPAPQQVSNIKVIPEAGGATILYQVPKDQNLAYVKAVYEIQKGVFREAKASIYTDTLKLVGFGDTSAHEVKIYSIGKNEKASEALSVMVSPKIPPVISAFKSIDMVATFGGVRVTFENKDRADLAVVLMVDTTGMNTWASATTYYSSAISGIFAARGYDTLEKRFAIFIRDRWNNRSDTLIQKIKPLYEMRIPKATWNVLELPTDQKEIAENYVLRNLWDGGDKGGLGSIYASSNASKLPQWFTIDLGKRVLISRFNEHQEAWNHLYSGSAVKRFEVWGSNNPDTDGGWKNWQLLGTFESYKPSGLPLGQVTDEDRNYANATGESFEFVVPPPAVRYLRWKTLETYASPGQVVIQELDLYGKIQD